MLINILLFLTDVWHESKREFAFFFLSPSYFIAGYRKWKANESKEDVKNIIKQNNICYFWLSVFFAVLVYNLEASKENYAFLLLISLYYFSRVNEIFIAFVKDATSHLRPEKHKSSLKYYERIPLAMRSYVELIIAYGVIAFFLSNYYELMSCKITLLQGVYYSGVTITTLGYGEITPTDWVTQFLAIYEVINGFSLIVVSFAVYVSKSIATNEYKIP